MNSYTIYIFNFFSPGANYPLDVIDVARQENIRMPMSEWVEYFNSSVRNKVYNCISLEFSKTRYAVFKTIFFVGILKVYYNRYKNYAYMLVNIILV